MSQLGAIADDFTGATDLATNLASRGFQVIVVPEDSLGRYDSDDSAYEAVVVALKTRTAPVERAVADSLRALEYLQGLGCERFYDKYCSTFDSTDEGNIGPILDALASRLGSTTTVVVPSFPANGRVVGVIDVSPLIAKVALADRDSVPNGIAYDRVAHRLYVTGKNWPSLFEIKRPR